MSNWHKVVDSDEKVSQGDILFDFPLFAVEPQTIDFSKSNWHEEPPEYSIYTSNVVVMTQACDLERNPVDNVLIARVDDINEMNFPEPRKGEKSTRRSFSKKVYGDKFPNLHLIGKHEEEPKMNYMVVDFSEVYSAPYELIDNFIKLHGPRLRLSTPHREYLSQRFGNFYTRIGLPNEDHITEQDFLACVNSDVKEG